MNVSRVFGSFATFRCAEQVYRVKVSLLRAGSNAKAKTHFIPLERVEIQPILLSLTFGTLARLIGCAAAVLVVGHLDG